MPLPRARCTSCLASTPTTTFQDSAGSRVVLNRPPTVRRSGLLAM